MCCARPKLILRTGVGVATDEQPHRSLTENARFLVEIPDRFAIARWSRDADVATICRCILGTLKYEPHTADITVLRQALEGVIKHEAGRERRAI